MFFDSKRVTLFKYSLLLTFLLMLKVSVLKENKDSDVSEVKEETWSRRKRNGGGSSCGLTALSVLALVSRLQFVAHHSD